MSGLLGAKDVNIRKDRVCYGCARKFPIGTKMQCVRTAEDGFLRNTYFCMRCKEYLNDNWSEDDYFVEGELTQDSAWHEIEDKEKSE